MKNLPKGWTPCKLEDLLIVLESGSRPKGGVRGINSGIPSIGGEHLVYNGTFNFSSVKYVPEKFAQKMNKGHIQLNDILVVKDGATTGKTAFVDEKFPFKNAVVNEHVFICRPSKSIEPKFLFRYLSSKNGQESILNNFQGSAQGGINLSFAPNTEIVLAPINEQRRIVEKLEKLLNKVDVCKERLNTIPTILKRFRQSILSAACSGRLTKYWRDKSEAKDWQQVKLETVIKDKPKNGYSAKPVNYETSYRVLTLTATTSGKFDPRYFKYFDEKISKDSPFWLKPGDICVQRGNTIEYVGVSAIYDGHINQFIYPDLMMRLRANSHIITKFLYYALSWEKTRNYLRERATGTAGNMPKINQQTLLGVPINLPSMPEQQEIVRRIEALFKIADGIEERYKKAKEYVDKLTQSILAKAFRGELVPQDPNDEPASVLLEKIKEEKCRAQKSSKTKVKIKKYKRTIKNG